MQLLFQSAVEVPLADRIVGFVGAQIGANHVSTGLPTRYVLPLAYMLAQIIYLLNKLGLC